MPGFPIRTPSDLSSVDSSPRLIAASYVLLRLLVPRHPPCALNNLFTKMLASTVQFSNNHPKITAHDGTSQTRSSHFILICGMTTTVTGETEDFRTPHHPAKPDRTARIPSGPNSVPNTPLQPPPRLPQPPPRKAQVSTSVVNARTLECIC